MKTFHFIHNIPSPYRLHLFNVLYRKLLYYGYDFHVHFMARSHSDRAHWQYQTQNISFPHSFWADASPLGKKAFHFNPGLIKYIHRTKPDVLVLGGLWDSITNALLALRHPCSVQVGWIEGNSNVVRRMEGVIGWLKRRLLRSCDLIAVPGEEGQKYLSHLFGNSYSSNNVIYLPNLVDEKLFKDDLLDCERDRLRQSLDIPHTTKVALWPARLIPEKGILEFLSKLAPQLLQGWCILLLGEGPLQKQVEESIIQSGLESFVRLKPYLPYESMPKVYKLADLFLLPSKIDPNPLSVIEALHSGLPVLISSKIGNYPEALEEGQNGWSINPDILSLQTIENAFSCTQNCLERMGKESERIAQEKWNSSTVVENFLQSVGIFNT